MIEFDYTILIQFLNFLILLILLKFLLFNPVLKVVKRREDTFKNLELEYQAMTSEIRNLESTYEERLIEKKRPVMEEKEHVLSFERQRLASWLEKERSEILKGLYGLKDEIEKEEKRLLDALLPTVERLSEEVMRKILGR